MDPLDILLCSYAYSPSIGGIETISQLLATGMTARGHRVTVVTETPGPDEDNGIPVIRRPGWRSLWSLMRRADIVWQSNLSIRLLWPAAFCRAPVLVTHHTWLDHLETRRAKTAAKRWAAARAGNSFVSRAVKDRSGLEGPVIPNGFDDDVFREDASVPRAKDIVFLGRLVSDKGADLLLEALGLLRARGLAPRTTIVGDGPERTALERQAGAAGLVDQVAFAGAVRGPALARLLNEHRIMAVPSRWDEPFGLVALEGIACGCVVVGTRGGGLPEAIGPCGELVPNGDPAALASTLEALLGSERRLLELRRPAAAHLAPFRPGAVLDQYERLLQQLRENERPRRGA